MSKVKKKAIQVDDQNDDDSVSLGIPSEYKLRKGDFFVPFNPSKYPEHEQVNMESYIVTEGEPPVQDDNTPFLNDVTTWYNIAENKVYVWKWNSAQAESAWTHDPDALRMVVNFEDGTVLGEIRNSNLAFRKKVASETEKRLNELRSGEDEPMSPTELIDKFA